MIFQEEHDFQGLCYLIRFETEYWGVVIYILVWVKDFRDEFDGMQNSFILGKNWE